MWWRAMADLDLQFAEELCPADDVLGRRWLVEHSDIPVFADKSVTRPGLIFPAARKCCWDSAGRRSRCRPRRHADPSPMC